MGYSTWKTIDEINTSQFLYHYTSLEKAYNILYGKELWFSDLSSTNDFFEQKIKLMFESNSKDNREKQKKVREYLEKERKRIKVLCFSMDTILSEHEKKLIPEMTKGLPKTIAKMNVLGRGFALPRMWAQYASNSNGVCFVFNKSKICSKIINDPKLQCHWKDRVVYEELYNPYLIKDEALNEIYNLILSEESYAIKKMIKEKYEFLQYDLFRKLSDWKTENEYRIVVATNKESDIAKLTNIEDAIEGIVLGAAVSALHEDIIRLLSGTVYDIRRIKYEDIITRIV